MNGKDIFLSLEYIGDDLIEEAEAFHFSHSASQKGDSTKLVKNRHRIRRPLLVAALIGLMLLLVGCVVVYVLNLEKIKISTGTDQRDYSLVDGVYVEDPHTVNTTTLTLAGLEGSDAYKACADFYAFKEEYTANGEKMAKNGTLPADYWETYSDVMNAKTQELAQQYGLKPEGTSLEFRTNRNFCDAMDVERFDRSNSEISVNIIGGSCYDTGNFWLNMDLVFPEDKGYEVLRSPGVLHWNRKDCFSRDYLTITDSGDWIEKNYTTASGSQVLILHSPSQETGLVLCDRGEALMALVFNANVEYLSEDGGVVSSELVHMTDRQLELVADAVDFSVQPRIPTQIDVAAMAGIPQEITQSGYTLKIKSVETDGYMVQILIGVTAPEGTVLPTEGNISFANHGGDLNPEFGSVSGGGGTTGYRDDGDGKANTVDILKKYHCVMTDGSVPFASGTTWNLHLVNIISHENGCTVLNTLAEGEWLFPITFGEDNGDYRAIELLSAPMTLKGSTGWRADGSDVVESCTVTSVKLRSQSISVTADVEENMYIDFFNFQRNVSYVVMKDGSQVEIIGQEFDEPIDLNQVDYVLLPDGTKLKVPET